MTTLPELIAKNASDSLNEDFRRGLGWCFTERFLYRHLAEALKLWVWPDLDGYSKDSLRIAAEYTLPFVPTGKRGRPLNVDVAVLRSKHKRRAAVRDQKNIRDEAWHYAAEVKWIAGNAPPSMKGVNDDLHRLGRLRGIKNPEHLHFIMAGETSQVTAWLDSGAKHLNVSLVASCLDPKTNFGVCVFSL